MLAILIMEELIVYFRSCLYYLLDINDNIVYVIIKNCILYYHDVVKNSERNMEVKEYMYIAFCVFKKIESSQFMLCS